LVERLFATACDFVDTVPIRLLTFYPDASVWDVVRNFAPDFNRNIQGVPEHA
jgi:hypothetical protein